MKYEKSWVMNYLILCYLSIYGEVDQCSIVKKIKKDFHMEVRYRTILRYFYPLMNFRLIKKIRTEPTKAEGKGRDIYSLTTLGLVAFLKMPGLFDAVDVGEDLDFFAKKYPDLLPLIFSKWDFFKKHNIVDDMVVLLENALTTVKDPLEKALNWKGAPSRTAHDSDKGEHVDPIGMIKMHSARILEKQVRMVSAYVRKNPPSCIDNNEVEKCEAFIQDGVEILKFNLKNELSLRSVEIEELEKSMDTSLDTIYQKKLQFEIFVHQPKPDKIQDVFDKDPDLKRFIESNRPS